VNAVPAQSVTAANLLRDVNLSGTLSLADKLLVNSILAKALLAPQAKLRGPLRGGPMVTVGDPMA